MNLFEFRNLRKIRVTFVFCEVHTLAPLGLPRFKERGCHNSLTPSRKTCPDAQRAAGGAQLSGRGGTATDPIATGTGCQELRAGSALATFGQVSART